MDTKFTKASCRCCSGNGNILIDVPCSIEEAEWEFDGEYFYSDNTQCSKCEGEGFVFLNETTGEIKKASDYFVFDKVKKKVSI